MSKKARELAVRYGRKTDLIETYRETLEEKYHISAFTNPDCIVITEKPEMKMMKWGLIPFWSKDEKNAFEIRKMTYNARSETIFHKLSFRNPIKSKRCIIPSTGYFEYHHEGTETIPYYIYLKTEEIFSFGGIYDSWYDKETGDTFYTYSIITTEANRFTGEIHNGGEEPQRMPLILNVEDEEMWMDHGLSNEKINKLMKPFPADVMAAYPINRDFIKMNPFNKKVLEEVE
jgi:putative SOS response-associated peptidase YedK